MCFSKPNVPTPAQSAPPADQGADALQVGGANNSNVAGGLIGRRALRVGDPSSPAIAPSASSLSVGM